MSGRPKREGNSKKKRELKMCVKTAEGASGSVG